MTSHALTLIDAATALAWTADPTAVTVLDVRSPAEFETAHLSGSHNVPLDLLGQHATELAASLDRPVVLVCQSGVRATQAAQRLAGEGLTDLHVLEGGLPALAAAGGPIVRGRARWALERQVRLVAGSLVLLGALASLVLPIALVLAIGIGAGLTFSALSNTCAMGAMLSKLPYNRGPAAPTARQVLARLRPAAQAA
ncbi:MAG: putative Rhodanese-related sulfurtransferase [Frankiales bacterium]|jgi:rhodanese-related sulfurtransferase|nr:putative Rhodanese-related sulfurtransferase [Frankiales bacterium]